MAHKLIQRDVQFGTEMAWHNLTQIPESVVLEMDTCFPYRIIYAPLGYGVETGENAMVQGTQWKKHQGTCPASGKKFNWVLPIASDDNLPVGFGNPINLATYTPETPQQNWEFATKLLEGTRYQVVSAGTVQNRSKFFVSIRLEELSKITTADGKEHFLNFNAKGSLDKSLRKQLSVSATTIVCYNTLMMDFLTEHSVEKLRETLGDKTLLSHLDGKVKLGWTYRHSKNMNARVEKDKPAMEQAAGFSAVVRATFDSLLKHPCSTDRAAAIYAGYISKPAGKNEEWPAEISARCKNMVDEHVFCFEHGDGASGETENDLLSGWTQPRTRGYAESDKADWDVYESSEMGTYANSKADFCELLTMDRPKLAEIEAKGRELLKTA